MSEPMNNIETLLLGLWMGFFLGLMTASWIAWRRDRRKRRDGDDRREGS